MNRFLSDIVVIGAGMAGFTAAVRASEKGARVVLVDKSEGLLGDGNILMTSGSLRAGGKSPRSDASELYEFVMAEGVAYPALARAWAENCARAVDWLSECGVVLSEKEPGRLWLDQQSEILLAPVYKKDVGRRALASLKRRFEQLGGRYTKGTEALSLIQETKRIHGIVGRNREGEVELRSRATILSTGGFSAAKDLLRHYIGEHADQCKLRGSKSCTGDGLRMALRVGAKAINLKYFYGHLLSRKALTDDRFWPYPRLDLFVDEGLLVDRNGHRFVDEGRGDVAITNELAWSKDVAGASVIFGSPTWEAAKEDAFSVSVKTPAPNPWLLHNDGDLFFSDSVEGLAKELGISGTALTDTVELFNRAVEAGDAGALPIPRTGKPKPLRPPYYGLKVVPGITFTMGGLWVNGRCEVLDPEEKHISGLYAAGDCIGGLMGGYRGGYTGGLMQAIVTGVLAGENAAEGKS